MDEARALLEDMQQTVDVAKAETSNTERSLNREIEEHMYSWYEEIDRAQCMNETEADDS